jgi:hypothetical protein
MKGGNLGFRCAASSTPDLIRQQRQQNVEEARKYGASLAGRAILQNKVAIVTCQLSIAVAALLLTFAWLKSWWLSGFAAYYGLVLADGLLFILDTRDRLAARIAFEVVHFAPALLICVVLQVIWHLPPLSALGGLLAGVLLGRILNAMLFPSIYDEYRLSRKGR